MDVLYAVGLDRLKLVRRHGPGGFFHRTTVGLLIRRNVLLLLAALVGAGAMVIMAVGYLSVTHPCSGFSCDWFHDDWVDLWILLAGGALLAFVVRAARELWSPALSGGLASLPLVALQPSRLEHARIYGSVRPLADGAIATVLLAGFITTLAAGLLLLLRKFWLRRKRLGT